MLLVVPAYLGAHTGSIYYRGNHAPLIIFILITYRDNCTIASLEMHASNFYYLELRLIILLVVSGQGLALVLLCIWTIIVIIIIYFLLMNYYLIEVIPLIFV